MRKKLTSILSGLLLGWLTLPSIAQQPAIPEPKPLPAPQPAEGPPPTIKNSIMPEVGNPIIVDAVGSGCCDQQRGFWSGTWASGIGAYYLVPFFSGNPSYFTQSTAGGKTTTSQHNFGYEDGGAPTAFLSYTLDSGLGIRGNYFSFHSSNAQTATGFNPGTSLFDSSGNFLSTPSKGALATADSELGLMVIDLEITQKWVFGCWWLQAGGGARYAHINQSYSLALADKVGGNALSTDNHDFNGFGPTISFEVHRKLFDSDFGIYSSVRGTLLFGSTSENLQVNSTVFTFASGTSNNTVLPVGEFEMGGEWDHCFGRIRVFGQLGVAGQIWGNAGNASSGNLGLNSPASFGFIGGVGRVGVAF